MITFKQFLLLESFSDAKRIWMSTERNYDQKDLIIDKAIADFKLLKDKHIISAPMSDISFWIKKGSNEFLNFITKTQIEYEKKRPLKTKMKPEDAEVVFENENAIVYFIKTKAAACKLGAASDWCISKEKHDYYEEYSEKGTQFYFLSIKDSVKNVNNDFKQLAITVYAEHISDEITIFDLRNEEIPNERFEKICIMLKVPIDIFHHKKN